jgi:glycosyltransferase involved in cell wall biosynthesis
MLLFLFSDKINSPTSYTAKKFGVLKNKMITIPLGEDPLFFNKSKPIQLNSKLGIIFPGQFRTGKNQDLLIYATHDYMEQTGDKNIVLYLPGSGDLLPIAEKLAKNLGISDSVVFPGQLSREEVLDLYNKCQIAVVPTNSETFGHCIAEPLVLQRILITRRVGVAIDVVKHGENGFFFESREDLVNLLKEIRKMNFEVLTEISKKAKETGEIFRWESIAMRHYHEIFKRFL